MTQGTDGVFREVAKDFYYEGTTCTRPNCTDCPNNIEIVERAILLAVEKTLEEANHLVDEILYPWPDRVRFRTNLGDSESLKRIQARMARELIGERQP